MREVKFTPERIEQIKNLVERGKRREEIAEFIGVTVGSLPIETRDETEANRIITGHKDDRNGIRCRLGRGYEGLFAKITVTRWLTRSAASAGSRLFLLSAQRYSMATFWPST